MRQWVRNPHQNTDQPFAFFCHFRSWPWNFASHEFRRCESVFVGTWSASVNWSTFCLLLTFWLLAFERRVAPVSCMLVFRVGHCYWTNFSQFSNWFQLFLLELRVIQARIWNLAELLHSPACQFTVSLNAFLSMSLHVVGPGYSFRVRFPNPVILQLLQQKYVIQTSLHIVQESFHFVCIHVEDIPSIHGQEMM